MRNQVPRGRVLVAIPHGCQTRQSARSLGLLVASVQIQFVNVKITAPWTFTHRQNTSHRSVSFEMPPNARVMVDHIHSRMRIKKRRGKLRIS
jgi:hypothetical protein